MLTTLFVAALLPMAMDKAMVATPLIASPIDRTPTIMGQSGDNCRAPNSLGFSSPTLAIVIGGAAVDENCIRLKNAKLLNDLGYRDAATQLMCDDPKVYAAMERANTPCKAQKSSK